MTLEEFKKIKQEIEELQALPDARTPEGMAAHEEHWKKYHADDVDEND